MNIFQKKLKSISSFFTILFQDPRSEARLSKVLQVEAGDRRRRLGQQQAGLQFRGRVGVKPVWIGIELSGFFRRKVSRFVRWRKVSVRQDQDQRPVDQHLHRKGPGSIPVSWRRDKSSIVKSPDEKIPELYK